MLALWSANLEKGRDAEYKNWVLKHVDEFKEFYAPHGWKLKGVYGSTVGLGRYDVTWVWEFSKFGDIDAIYRLSDPKMDRLQDEENDFYVPGSINTIILRELRDWNVSTRAKPKKSKR